MTFVMEGIIEGRMRFFRKNDRGVILNLRPDVLENEEIYITAITAAMVKKSINRGRKYPSIERFKRECDLYMVHIDHHAIAEDIQKSAAEEKGDDYFTEVNEVFQATLKESYGIHVHFPLDTQDKVIAFGCLL